MHGGGKLRPHGRRRAAHKERVDVAEEDGEVCEQNGRCDAKLACRRGGRAGIGQAKGLRRDTRGEHDGEREKIVEVVTSHGVRAGGG